MAGSKGIKRVDAGTTLTYAEYHDEVGVEIVSGTSFPASPSQKDLFYRTDLNTWFQYTGGRWQAVGEPHVLESFHIYKIGSTYYQRYGNTGQLSSNASFHTLVNGAVNALTNGGVVSIGGEDT